MISRRDFLKKTLALVAATAINRNGVWQPERKIFDMAANTWRKQGVLCSVELLIDSEWVQMGWPVSVQDPRYLLKALSEALDMSFSVTYIMSDKRGCQT